MENYFLILEEDDTDEYCNSRLCTLQDFDPTKLHNAEFWSPYENYQTLKACIFFTFLLLYLRYLRNKNIRFTSNIFILIILCSFLDWLQAYFILLYFALLCFIYVAIFTNWRFVAARHWARLLEPFFQKPLLTSCLCAHFGDYHNISNPPLVQKMMTC